jgi:hypothetical protein
MGSFRPVVSSGWVPFHRFAGFAALEFCRGLIMISRYARSNKNSHHRALQMLIAAAGGVLVPTAIAAADTTANWLTAVDGNWSTAARWSTSPNVPNNGNGGVNYLVNIAASGAPYLLTLDSDITVDDVTVNNVQAFLAQTGGIFQAGTINLDAGKYVLAGGTLLDTTVNLAGGSFHGGGGTLNNVHVSGGDLLIDATLTVISQVVGGLTVDNHTIDVTGYAEFTSIDQTGNTLNVSGVAYFDGGSQTIDHVTISGNAGTIYAGSPAAGQGSQALTLGAHAVLEGILTTADAPNISSTPASTLINNGTINAASSDSIEIGNTNFTNNATAEATGAGVLSIDAAAWSNASGGTISANASTLNFNVNNPGNWTNAGTITATNASTINLGGSFATSDIGSLTASADSNVVIVGALNNATATLTPGSFGGIWSLGGGTITGGTVNLAGGNFSVQSGTLDTVHFTNGDLAVKGGTLTVKNSLVVDTQNINVSGAGGAVVFQGSVPGNLKVTLGDDTSLTFDGPSQSVSNLTITGNRANPDDAPAIHISGAYAGGGIILEPENTTTISGSLYIDDGAYPSTLTNNGTINANHAGQMLTIYTTTFKNFATLKATNGGYLVIGPNTAYTEDGTLDTTKGVFQNDGAATIFSAAKTAAITGAGTLNLQSGSSLTIAANSAPSTQTGLIINSALMDINNNSLTLNYGSNGSPNGMIRGYISSAYNVSGTTWSGTTGITSSAAAGDPAHHTVAFADGADGNVLKLPAGVSTAIPAGGVLPAGYELITYAYAGDANLDGKVDFNDFVAISTHFLESDVNWDDGNFNYDGVVNFNDFVVLSTNFGEGVTGGDGTGATAAELAQFNAMAAAYGISQSQIASWDSTISNLPEPCGFMAGGMALLLLLSRRRRLLSGVSRA